ncbi:MAG: sigma-54 dependent transcriptional regulator [Rhodobacteraceae bacterium]|nr:sigma-54 dependent transcriptional regulator [Paracoccaceae bacterium]
MTNVAVILIDDEEEVRRSLEQAMSLEGFEVASFARAERAVERIGPGFAGAVVSDIRMPKMDGLALLRAVGDVDPEIPVILITGHGDVPLAVEAMRLGAYDLLEKPLAPKRLADVVRRAAELRRLTIENRAMRADLEQRDPLESTLIGQAAGMVDLREEVRAIASSEIDVLIQGETGTGKEVVARAIHDASDRRSHPFVAINLSALPAASIESELFGHDAGAFPGAHRTRFGKFEHARGGTLYLDEIGAAPLALQVKLLRVIEERVIERLGSNERIDLNVRFIASSNQDLCEMVQRAEFRSDLLYRLAVVTLTLPPLRDRLEDIPRLFHHLLQAAAKRMDRDPPDIPPELLADLSLREWQGNVRELRNLAERFVLGLDREQAATVVLNEPLAVQIERFERGVIASVLARHGGSLKETYESLGLSRKTLYEKMARHGLKRQDFGDIADD